MKQDDANLSINGSTGYSGSSKLYYLQLHRLFYEFALYDNNYYGNGHIILPLNQIVCKNNDSSAQEIPYQEFSQVDMFANASSRGVVFYLNANAVFSIAFYLVWITR